MNWSTKSDVKYVAWTGGFDSTALVYYMLVVQGWTIQPFYIAANNTDGGDRFGLLFRRRNVDYEMRSMQNFRDWIKKKYGGAVSSRLRETIIVDESEPADDLLRASKACHAAGVFTRDVNQYTHIANCARAFGDRDSNRTGLFYVYVGFIRDDKSAITNNLTALLKNGGISYDNAGGPFINEHGLSLLPYMSLMSQFKFPLFTMTKRDIYHDLVLRGVGDDILNMTVSCWYPRRSVVTRFINTLTALFGNNDDEAHLNEHVSCGVCDMCRGRMSIFEGRPKNNFELPMVFY